MKHPCAVLTDDDVIYILQMLKKGFRHKTLAFLFNTSAHNISCIAMNRCWKHINRENYSINYSSPKGPYRKVGRQKKLTEEIVLNILSELDNGEKQLYLSCKYNISMMTVHKLNQGLSWSHITGYRATKNRDDDDCKRKLLNAN